MIATQSANATRFDLEDPRDETRLAAPMLALEPLRGLVVLDEIQHRPDLFPIFPQIIRAELAQQTCRIGAQDHLRIAAEGQPLHSSRARSCGAKCRHRCARGTHGVAHACVDSVSENNNGGSTRPWQGAWHCA